MRTLPGYEFLDNAKFGDSRGAFSSEFRAKVLRERVSGKDKNSGRRSGRIHGSFRAEGPGWVQ